MAIRTRFAALLLIFAILPSRWLFAQEATAKNRPRAPSEQTTTESNARFSRTHCDVQERSDVGCVVMRPNRMRTYPKA